MISGRSFVQWSCSAAVWALLTAFTYAHFVHIVPASTTLSVLHSVIGLFVLANIVYNFAILNTRRPARVPKFRVPDAAKQASTPDEFERAMLDAMQNGFQTEHNAACKACRNLKPARAHHCSVLNACLLKYDHACIWANTTVAHNNYRFFLLFLIWTMAGCVFVVMGTAGPMILGHGRAAPAIYEKHEAWVVGCAIIAAVAGGALGPFLLFHIWLTATNQTSVEWRRNRKHKANARRKGVYWHNPYDLGITNNVEQVLGAWTLWALLPGWESLGDGIVFPQVHYEYHKC